MVAKYIRGFAQAVVSDKGEACCMSGGDLRSTVLLLPRAVKPATNSPYFWHRVMPPGARATLA